MVANIQLALNSATFFVKELIGDNDLRGVDESSDQEIGPYYMLSYGQNGLCFYKMNEDMELSAHRAFLIFEHGAF